jgi:alkylation response protein AidB-like acyl-CoA dehydrogenase
LSSDERAGGHDGVAGRERLVVQVVREFVNERVRPVVRELEHANAYPEALVEEMKELGVFGPAVPAPYGDVQLLRAGDRGCAGDKHTDS